MHNAQNQYYYERADRNAETLNGGKADYIKNYLRRILKDNDSLLEVGCGTANTINLLSEAVYYTGIDLSEYAIEKAKKKNFGRTNINLVVSSSDKLPFENREFDVVLAMFSLEHFKYPRESVFRNDKSIKKWRFFSIMRS